MGNMRYKIKMAVFPPEGGRAMGSKVPASTRSPLLIYGTGIRNRSISLKTLTEKPSNIRLSAPRHIGWRMD